MPDPRFPSDWYWLADDSRVFSSARQVIVDASDAGYKEFLATGGLATVWPRDDAGAQTVAALQTVLTPYGLFADLKAYAAAARYAKETAGIAVGNAQIATDRDSQGMVAGAYAYVQANPSVTTNFKTASGFVSLSAAQITSIAMAVGGHVQACFAAEAQVDSGLSASPPTIKSTADVDAVFAAIAA